MAEGWETLLRVQNTGRPRVPREESLLPAISILGQLSPTSPQTSYFLVTRFLLLSHPTLPQCCHLQTSWRHSPFPQGVWEFVLGPPLCLMSPIIQVCLKAPVDVCLTLWAWSSGPLHQQSFTSLYSGCPWFSPQPQCKLPGGRGLV